MIYIYYYTHIVFESQNSTEIRPKFNKGQYAVVTLAS